LCKTVAAAPLGTQEERSVIFATILS
jgi:hypothetical protein